VDHPVTVDYAALDAKIADFFKTGTPPVPNRETLEIYAFMDAAERSKETVVQAADSRSPRRR
jgi:hypothetical protein